MGQCMSQSFQAHENTDGTKSFYLTRNNEIISAICGKSFNGDLKPSMKYLKTSNDTIVQNHNNLNNPESRTSHHVTLRFEIMTFNIFMTSAENSYVGMDFNWTGGHKVGEIDVQEGVYDIMISTYDFMNSGDEMYVFLHGLNVIADIDTTINLTELANNYVYFHGMDENHILLSPNDTMLIAESKEIHIEFPEPFVFQNFSNNMSGFVKDYIRFSNVNPGYNIGLCQSDVKMGKMYVLELGHLNGISADTVLESDPDMYKKMSHVFFESPSAKNDYLAFGTGAILKLRDDPSYWMNNMFLGNNTNYPSHDSDSITIYLNNTFKNSNRINYVGEVDFWEDVPEYGAPDKKIQGKPFYITTGDTIQYCMFYPPAKADYSVLNNAIVNFGNSTPFINTYSVNDANSIFNYSDVFGQSNEARVLDDYSSLYDIKQGTDILQSDTLFKFEQPYSVPSSGSYSFSITDSNYYIKGLQGKITSQNNFNIPSADPNPPVLTSFKILNANGLIRESFSYSALASLHFSAGDFTNNEVNVIDAAYLYYKKYNEDNWTSLPVEEIPEFYDSVFSYGQYFTSDLTPVINSCTDTTFIDLKLVLTDLSSNSTIETFHPAFQVRDVGVGTHENVSNDTEINLKAIPNPITETSFAMFNLPAKSNVRITIASLTGHNVRLVLDTTLDPGRHTVNLFGTNGKLSDLSPGMYLLRLESGNTVETVKLIVY